MDVYKHIEEAQKKLFNDSSVVQYENSTYIYPYTSFHKDVSSNSLNRYYRNSVKKKMFNILDNDDRVLEMIEKIGNKKAIELLKKDKERKKKKLYHEIFQEDENKNNYRSQSNINLGNFREKLKDNMFNSESGDNILYILMECLLNRKKNSNIIKNKNGLKGIYSRQKKDFYSNKISKLIENSNNNSLINTTKNSYKEINNIKKDFPIFQNKTFRDDKIIKYDLSSMRKSKSQSNLKSISKKYLSEKKTIDNKVKTDYFKQHFINNYNELDFPPLINNNSTNNSYNKEKLNNFNKEIIGRENNKEKDESLLFKKQFRNNNINSLDNFPINYPGSEKKIFLKKIKYINLKKFNNFKKQSDKENSSDIINNIENKNNKSSLIFQKNKRSLLLNLKKITNRADEVSQQINRSFRGGYKLSLKSEVKDKNTSQFFTKRSSLDKNISTKMTKEERENMFKYNPGHIIYSNKSNYNLSQTNRHFFGANKGMDAIDFFKQNLSQEIRKQFIEKNKNLLQINMKKIIKKFIPNYKFFE